MKLKCAKCGKIKHTRELIVEKIGTTNSAVCKISCIKSENDLNELNKKLFSNQGDEQ